VGTLLGLAATVYLVLHFLVFAKVGAGRAERELKREFAARSVHCEDGRYGWDYDCVIRPADGSAFDISVNVDRNGITEESAP
jgi:hypothetical protein